MDLSYSDEQRLLGDTVNRFVAERYSLALRRSTIQSAGGCNEDMWKSFADLGWLGLAIPEEFGGLGASQIETNLVMEAFGRGLVVEPYVAVAVLASGLITELGSVAQKQMLLPEIASARRRVVVACSEPRSRYDLHSVSTRAVRQGDGWSLVGQKLAVRGGPSAGTLLVSARVAGDTEYHRGVGMFLVPADAKGVRTVSYQGLDGIRTSNVELDHVSVPLESLLGMNDDALPALEKAVDRAIVAMASQAVGCMQALLEATVLHVKSRVQFGKPLSHNQIIRHRLVDIAIGIDDVRASALNAALLIDGDPNRRKRAVSGAKVKAARCGRFAAEQAVQLHGAMGVTEELSVGEYFKTLMCIDTLFGNADHHLQRHADVGQLAS